MCFGRFSSNEIFSNDSGDIEDTVDIVTLEGSLGNSILPIDNGLEVETDCFLSPEIEILELERDRGILISPEPEVGS